MKWSILYLSLLICPINAGEDVIQIALDNNVPQSHHRDFGMLLRAIHKAENGPTRQFGVIHPSANTLEKQARWCAATCWKNYQRWLATDQQKPYLVFLRDRYAPLGADNDPSNLNENWLKNVVYFLEEQE